MRNAIPIALAIAVTALAPATADAAKTARFKVTVKGLQTTKWTSSGPTYSNCNGTPSTRGEGTEVVRIDSGRPEKLRVDDSPSGPIAQYGSWRRETMPTHPGLFSDLRVTRQGRIVHSWSGGWCGRPPEQDTGPYDCGSRKGTGYVYLNWHGKRVLEVSVREHKPVVFSSCPIVQPSMVREGDYSETLGRLSRKLLFGSRDRIVVEDGQTFKREEPFANSVATTHFRIVLERY